MTLTRRGISLLSTPISFFLIIGLILQMVLFAPPRSASAAAAASKSVEQQPAPNAAPPEPFVIDPAQAVTKKAGTAFSAIRNIFTTPKPPEGLEIARMPTFSERLISYLGSFALFAGMTKASSSEAPAPSPPPAAPVDFDFDNDGKTDRGRWHRDPAEFKVRKSTDGNYLTYTLGSSSAIAAPGDYNGDGITDAGVFLNGTWTYKTSTGGSAQTMNWGTTGDKPVPGRYDSDTSTDFAIWRPGTTGYWYVYKSSDSNWYSVAIGTTGDIPAVGDFDGDGLSDQAVFRPSNGNWYINGSAAGSYTFHWGTTGDIPVAADFDGDGETDPAVYRPSTGYWYAYKSFDNDGSYTAQAWGTYGDQPVPGYYDGDSKADFAIWRPTTGAWYTINSLTSTYSYELLGVPGDQAVPSAYIPQVGSTVAADLVAKERLSPKNATGGTNLYSDNFGWSTGLVGLPGRSGMDMGFGLSYNSLIWLKVGNAMIFDPDKSNITPGFRFGFPTIEPAYYDDDKDVWAYIMVTPSGGRMEFRQTAVSNIYDTADSSYTQLVTIGATNPNDPVEDITIKVTSTDGTQMSYVWKAGAFRCTQIKDRNGNYITITHNDYGDLETVADTLGRVITVNYSGEKTPTSITQTWKNDNGGGSTNVTHNWATFTYTTLQIDTNFGSPITDVFGPPDGTYINVLQKVTRSDGSYTTFDYNTWGQVKQINSYPHTGSKLSHIAVNLPANASSSLTDCPRFNETRSNVQNFNGGNDVVFNHTKTTGQTYSLPNSISGTATRIQTWMTGHPDDLRTNTFVAESGWKEGLPVATEDCITTSATCSTRKRWTWTDWTQDNTSAAYPINPRSIESRVGDGTNTKRSTTEYYLYSSTTIAIFGLVKESIVYKTDLTNTEKKVFYEYDLNTAYTNLRIIGVPYATYVYGYDQETSSLNLVSMMTYAFDEGDFSNSTLSQNISPVQHDSTNYSSSFVTGRANLTSVKRWDVSVATPPGSFVTSSMKYNTAGSVVSKTDPMSRTVKISYTDNFNSTVSGSTYAYPTTLTDPADNSSTVKYRYDMGANVEATSPAPAGNSYGKKTKRLYDIHGRLERDSVYVNTTEKAYVRYDYPTNGIQSLIYSPVNDLDNDGNIAEDEVLTESWSDGAGRVRMARTENPGSTGGFSGILTEYDILGRLKRKSVPTEIDSDWDAAGDDLSRGFLWSHQKYDWKNRITRKIATDGIDQVTLNDSDVIISYDGCGCAGGQVTTIEGEVMPIPGTSSYARSKQKVYDDILGRQFKTETYNWDGSTVYSTVVNAYNGRDQVTLATHYSGGTSSSTFQETTATYDGHGRVASTHRPEQRVHIVGTLKNTTYTYNDDDSIASITDARGATKTYSYNSGGLTTSIAYTVPGSSGIIDPADITFEYDDLGNRTSMTDGLGEVTYEYNELSQMTAETRHFTDLASSTSSPNDDGNYRLEYTYNVAGQLKSYKEPYELNIKYTHDKVGRLSSVAGVGSSSTTTFASNVEYRAWGGLTHIDYGNGTEMNMGGFNNRNQATTFEVKKSSTQIINKEYQYYNDGSLRKEDDNVNAMFDRSYQYDFLGRLTESRSGVEASGGTGSASTIPFRNSYTYDAFGNRTGNTFTHYTRSDSYSFPHVNNRPGYHDDEGNLITDLDFSQRTYYHDASNSLVKSTVEGSMLNNDVPPVEEFVWATEDYGYDGDGLLIKTKKYNAHQTGPDTDVEAVYKVRSSVLGGEVVTELESGGGGIEVYVRANGTVIATVANVTGDDPAYRHKDPNLNTIRTTDGNGAVITSVSGVSSLKSRLPVDLDPDGKDLEQVNPYVMIIPDPEPNLFLPGQEFSSLRNGNFQSYTVDGISVTAGHMGAMIDQAFGGLFGLIEHTARRTARPIGKRIEVRPLYEPSPTEPPVLKTASKRLIIPRGGTDRSEDYGTLTVISPIYSMNWSLNLGLLPDEKWKSQEYKLARDEVKKLAFLMKDHLDNQPDCRNFINRLLNQMAADSHFGEGAAINLEGDIDYYLDKFSNGGSAEVVMFIDNHGGSGGGGLLVPSYGEPGWGTDFSWNLRNQVSSTITALHELIHAIGYRGEKRDKFGDKAATEAILKLGIAKLSDYPLTPTDIKNGYGPGGKYEGYNYSRFFGEVMSVQCKPVERIPALPNLPVIHVKDLGRNL